LRGGTDIGLETTTKYLRRPASVDAGNGPGTMIKYLRRTASIGLSTTIKYL
jgi:hypothetical protein